MNKEKALQLQNVTILFDSAWDTYKRYFKTLLSINFIPVIVGVLVLSVFSMIGDFEQISGYLTRSDFMGIFALVFGVSIISVVVSSLNYIAQVVVLGHSDNDTKISAVEAYGIASKMLFSYLWLMILAGLIVFLGFLLLVVPGIVFSVWFIFASFFLILKGEKGKEALRKSKRHVKGIWTEVFIRLIVAAFLGLLLSVAVAVFKSFLISVSSGSINSYSMDMIFDFLYSLVVTPYFMVYIYELYKDVVNANESVIE